MCSRAALDRSQVVGRAAVQVVHDAVYRALRDAQEPLAEQQLLELVAQSHDKQRLRLSLVALGQDFDLLAEESADGPRYALGDFKAFRGREPRLDALLRHQGMA